MEIVRRGPLTAGLSSSTTIVVLSCDNEGQEEPNMRRTISRVVENMVALKGGYEYATYHSMAGLPGG